MNTGQFALLGHKSAPTSLLNHIQARVGNIMVLDCVLILFGECTNENWVVLLGDECNCIQTEMRRHDRTKYISEPSVSFV